MAKLKTPNPPLAGSTEPLYREIQTVLEKARTGAYRAVNAAMVQAYWHIGRLIVEHEQGGAKRAAYGEAVLDELSRRLMADFSRGFDVTNLRKMRQFYRMFEIRDALRLESSDTKRDAARLVSEAEAIRHTVSDELSWSHYRLLMQVEDPVAREWYLREAVDQHWSTRQLERQIRCSITNGCWRAARRRPFARRPVTSWPLLNHRSSSAILTCLSSST